MFLSAVTFAKAKSKTILVKMLSQAGTGFSFNTKRSRLREKLTLLHYDPVEKAESQSRVILKELPCNNRDGRGEQECAYSHHKDEIISFPTSTFQPSLTRSV
ncbi:large ribosomal subunit protein bL33m isoform X2 [Globicephala melas]|uniref:large ribosomal subunit protein bL33m isoform X2 n=1 Tax=Globicephala melas TaxID=9731 RepID=UPI00122F5AF3|nr:39S ribosomal protein L33, mitochondrial isoform X3 [Globicephala melas]XP_060165502.1 large ribosomal subunit protein bL33m isoform X3 [Globicephala melas]